MKTKPEIEKLLSIIDSITKTPGMAGINNSNDIFHFLQGYRFASNEEVNELILGFNDFANQSYYNSLLESKIQIEVQWNNWIRFLTVTDFESIELFKTLFQKYIRYLGLSI